MKNPIRLQDVFVIKEPPIKTSKKVLMVDSNYMIAKQVGKLITSINHQSLGCVSDLNSLERRIRLKEPDVIIINIAMQAALDGYQIAKILKLDYEIPFYILCDERENNLKKWADELNPDGLINYSPNTHLIQAQLKLALN